MSSLSVIIPAYNEEKYLAALLSDLAKQTKLPEEVIVVDCISEDKTLEVAKTFNKRLPVKLVKCPRRNVATARNLGAQAAQGSYLLFIDADMRLPKNLIEELRTSIAETTVDYITPSYKSDRGHLIDRINVALISMRMKLLMEFLHKPDGIGGVICIKKDFHKKIGGFDETMHTHEDLLYMRSLRKNSASFIYRKDLKTITSSRRFTNASWADGLKDFLLLLPFLKTLAKSKQYGHYKK